MTREEEAELAMKAKAGDKGAIAELMRLYAPYVDATARKYRRYGLPHEELVAEAQFGMFEAMRRFDSTRASFPSYAAIWMKSTILEYVVANWTIVSGGGRLRSRVFFGMTRARKEATDDSLEAISKKLAERLDKDAGKVRLMAQLLSNGALTLNSTLFEDRPSIGDVLPSEGMTPEEAVGDREEKTVAARWWQHAKDLLSERELAIIQQRWLVQDPKDVVTLEALGERFGISRERVRQIEAEAKKKLSTWAP